MDLELMNVVNVVARRDLVRRGARALRVPVHGHDVHLMDMPGTGAAPPIVLLHGLGSSGLTFSRIIPALAKLSKRVYAADLPGSGFSPLPAPPLDLLGSMRILEALYASALAEPAIVVGNSLGGAMAATLAAEHPELVRGLVLVAPAGAKVSPERFQAMVESFSLTSWTEGRDFLRRLYHHPPPLVPELLALDMVKNFARPEVQILLRGDRPSDHLEPETLARLSMPTLLLWGKSERILPYEGLGYFRAHLPVHAVIEEVEGFGHAPHLDAPRELVERIGRFVASAGR